MRDVYEQQSLSEYKPPILLFQPIFLPRRLSNLVFITDFHVLRRRRCGKKKARWKAEEQAGCFTKRGREERKRRGKGSDAVDGNIVKEEIEKRRRIKNTKTKEDEEWKETETREIYTEMKNRRGMESRRCRKKKWKNNEKQEMQKKEMEDNEKQETQKKRNVCRMNSKRCRKKRMGDE